MTRTYPLLTVIAALVGLVAVGAVGVLIIQPARPLLADVTLSHTQITPNADGHEDATEIRYTLNRTAYVTIVFSSQTTGTQFVFRDGATRAPNTYQVLFSGVVDGYQLPGEAPIEGSIEQRLIPDGVYTWTVEATSLAGAATDSGTGGETMRTEGELVISEGDSQMPVIQSMDVSPRVFTPNQDGYDDRIAVNVYLAKAARLTAYLQGTDGVRYFLPERFEGREPGEAGAHTFDYDGGVDNDVVPPPDGPYTLVMIAEDDEGQRFSRTDYIEIRDSGLPNAEIIAQQTGRTLTWDTLPWDDAFFSDAQTAGQTVEAPAGVTSSVVQITLPQGDLLLFRLTVSNYGTTPIRTLGPWPGTVYEYTQTDAAMFAGESRDAFSGAWRVGVQCERSETPFPWRWAMGTPAELTRVERDGETLWYLEPGQRANVWGAIRMTRVIPTRNPQKCYAALIHEDVAIPPLQGRVGEIDVRLIPTEAAD